MNDPISRSAFLIHRRLGTVSSKASFKRMSRPRRLNIVAAQDRPIVAQSDAAWERTVVAAYERDAKMLWEYGRRLGRDLESSEDAVQEAFARLIWLPVGRRPANVRAWLFRTVHNLAVDDHRRSRRIVVGIVSGLAEAKVELDPDESQRLALWQAVDLLPVRQREVIFLRYRADLDFATIATITGITESGARANAFRAITSLRKAVERWR
jgi:RNA polymerase sigma factor (sigma-70 family)